MIPARSAPPTSTIVPIGALIMAIFSSSVRIRELRLPEELLLELPELEEGAEDVFVALTASLSALFSACIRDTAARSALVFVISCLYSYCFHPFPDFHCAYHIA